MKKAVLLSLLLTGNAIAGGDTGVIVYPAYGVTDHYLIVTSKHIVDVTNQTGSAQSYDYKFSLCPYAERCVEFNNHFVLNSGQHFEDQRQLTQNAKYHISGDFPATATSTVMGGGLNVSHIAHGNIVVN